MPSLVLVIDLFDDADDGGVGGCETGTERDGGLARCRIDNHVVFAGIDVLDCTNGIDADKLSDVISTLAQEKTAPVAGQDS